jgi:hypothetical protein
LQRLSMGVSQIPPSDFDINRCERENQVQVLCRCREGAALRCGDELVLIQ